MEATLLLSCINAEKRRLTLAVNLAKARLAQTYKRARSRKPGKGVYSGYHRSKLAIVAAKAKLEGYTLALSTIGAL